MKKGGLLLILLILVSIASGCISESNENQTATASTVPPTSVTPSQSSTPTTSTSTYGPSERTELKLPSVNYTPIYVGIEKGCPSGRVPVKFTYNPGNKTVKSVSPRELQQLGRVADGAEERHVGDDRLSPPWKV